MPGPRKINASSIQSIAGYAETIRENLARIDAVLPLVPLPVPTLDDAEAETKSQATVDPALAKPPAPKGLLAPGGRIPTTKPRSTRRR